MIRISDITRRLEIAYRCMIYDGSDECVRQMLALPVGALTELCGWTLYVWRDIVERTSGPISDELFCALMLEASQKAKGQRST
jgi:hypothetical protein